MFIYMSNNNLIILNNIFIDSYNALKYMKENNMDKDNKLSKLYDLFYDTVDTVEEVLNILGAKEE